MSRISFNPDIRPYSETHRGVELAILREAETILETTKKFKAMYKANAALKPAGISLYFKDHGNGFELRKTVQYRRPNEAHACAVWVSVSVYPSVPMDSCANLLLAVTVEAERYQPVEKNSIYYGKVVSEIEQSLSGEMTTDEWYQKRMLWADRLEELSDLVRGAPSKPSFAELKDIY